MIRQATIPAFAYDGHLATSIMAVSFVVFVVLTIWVLLAPRKSLALSDFLSRHSKGLHSAYKAYRHAFNLEYEFDNELRDMVKVGMLSINQAKRAKEERRNVSK